MKLESYGLRMGMTVLAPPRLKGWMKTQEKSDRIGPRKEARRELFALPDYWTVKVAERLKGMTEIFDCTNSCAFTR